MRRVEHLGPAIVVVIAAAVLLVAGPMAYRGYRAARTEAEVREASRRLLDNPILDALNQASRDVARVVEPSVVHVSTAGVTRGRGGSRGFASSGSGWIWDDLGHIVTNAHVVDGASTIEVQLFDGSRREATLVGMELRADVAVLRIPSGGLMPAQRSSDEPRQGELVFAFGSPFDFRFSVSSGIVSGVGRTAGLADLDYENFIQVDAAINPGNSGGPLTDIMGRVIGMNTAIATGRGSTLGQGQSAGIGLAIPMEMIESVVTQIISTGRAERAYLGVSVIGLADLRQVRRPDGDPMVAAALRTPQGEGVLVTSVVPGSPAADAGLRVGDVITAIAGVRVAAQKQVFAVVGTQRPGARVKIDLWRPETSGESGERLTLQAALVPSDPEVSYVAYAAAVRASGLMRLSTATPENCALMGVPFRRGVLIEEIAPGSSMARSLDAGTIITAVDGQSVASVDEFYTRLVRLVANRLLRGSEVTLTVANPSGEVGVVALRLDQR
ncbi:MAG: trypsin-like peptidase domain-containing protein [Phycisphaeraceae bacterium]|nr:trypsin-like peptidase domain-containing protein [Phycisphaeraceae bacterium]